MVSLLHWWLWNVLWLATRKRCSELVTAGPTVNDNFVRAMCHDNGLSHVRFVSRTHKMLPICHLSVICCITDWWSMSIIYRKKTIPQSSCVKGHAIWMGILRSECLSLVSVFIYDIWSSCRCIVRERKCCITLWIFYRCMTNSFRFMCCVTVIF